MSYTLEGEHVYRTQGNMKFLVGDLRYEETVRMNPSTVTDVRYVFNFETGAYEEFDRIDREEPEPTPEPDRITQLEDEAAMLALELVDTQIRLDQSETDHAALLFELVDKGGL